MPEKKTLQSGAATLEERIEKRLVGRALLHWESLRGERRYPSVVDYENGAPPYEPADVFVIRIRDSELADEVVYAGDALATALGRDPVGRRAIEVLPSSTEMGLSFCRAAAQLGKPIADIGQFTNADGAEVCYRSILLPLSQDAVKVDHVLGAFSFKFME
jgi:hypothetical protein